MSIVAVRVPLSRRTRTRVRSPGSRFGRVELLAAPKARFEIVVHLVQAPRMRRPVHLRRAQVHLPAAHACDAAGAVEELLARAQPVLADAPIGDVLERTHEADGRAAVVAHRPGARAHDAHGGVRTADAELHLQFAPAGRHLAPAGDHAVAVVLVHHPGPAVALPLLRRRSVDLLPTRVGVGPPALQVGEVDAQRRRFGQRPEPRRAVAQRKLGRAQRRDVDDLDGEAPDELALALGDVADLRVLAYPAVTAAHDILEDLVVAGQCTPDVRLAAREALRAEDALQVHAHDARRVHRQRTGVREVGEPTGQVGVEVRQHRRDAVDESTRQQQGLFYPRVRHAGLSGGGSAHSPSRRRVLRGMTPGNRRSRHLPQPWRAAHAAGARRFALDLAQASFGSSAEQ
jgi:hypothetical protein